MSSYDPGAIPTTRDLSAFEHRGHLLAEGLKRNFPCDSPRKEKGPPDTVLYHACHRPAHQWLPAPCSEGCLARPAADGPHPPLSSGQVSECHLVVAEGRRVVESKGEGVRREHTGGVQPRRFTQETGEKSVCGNTGLQQFEAIQPEMPHSEVGHLPDQAAQGFLHDAAPAGTRLVQIQKHKPENPGRCNLRDTGWNDLAHRPRQNGLRLGEDIREGCLHGTNRRVRIHHEVSIFGIGECIRLQVLAWGVGENDLRLSARQAIAPSPLAPRLEIPTTKRKPVQQEGHMQPLCREERQCSGIAYLLPCLFQASRLIYEALS